MNRTDSTKTRLQRIPSDWNERGWALVVAMAVMVIMLGVGIAVASLADNQIRLTRTDRVREAAMNLAEGALTAQQYRLPYAWPATSGKAYPSQCPSAVANPQCPDTTTLLGASGLFNSTSGGGIEYQSKTPTWVTRVRDDNVAYPSSGWNDFTTATESNARWDANGDNRMWIRADGWIGSCAATPAATATCKRRALVGLVNLETFQESFPKNVLTTGGFTITPNSGQHHYVCVYGVDAQGNCLTSSATGSQVLLRCTPLPGDPQPASPCEGFTTNQVFPQVVNSGGLAVPPAMNTGELSRFIDQAKATNTYCPNPSLQPGDPGYTFCNGGTCPDLSQATSTTVVVVEPALPTTTCSYTGSPTYNAMIVIFTNGVLKLAGGTTYNGLIYHTHGCSPSFPTPSNVTGCLASLVPGTAATPQVDIEGTARVNGGVAVDGLGFTVLGSSSDGALAYDPSKFTPLASAGAAGLVQSTWRELPANQP
jgi:type II secretory pathway pseudopilin PulG